MLHDHCQKYVCTALSWGRTLVLNDADYLLIMSAVARIAKHMAAVRFVSGNIILDVTYLAV